MRIAILTANLGNFDTPVDPIEQNTSHEVAFHRFTDDDFPPVTGLTPRLQYRIPKLFGWQMYPGYDAYIWLDGSMTFGRPDSLEWFVFQLGEADCAFFKHPVRKTIRHEVRHINEKLLYHPYIITRYKNGLHNENLKEAMSDFTFKDRNLYASTVFMYRNTENVQDFMWKWWAYQSRYYSCDQVALPYAIHKSNIKVNKIMEDQYKTPFLQMASYHK